MPQKKKNRNEENPVTLFPGVLNVKNLHHKFCYLESRLYTGDPIHRGPLFRDIQYIANRPWTPNLP